MKNVAVERPKFIRKSGIRGTVTAVNALLRLTAFSVPSLSLKKNHRHIRDDESRKTHRINNLETRSRKYGFFNAKFTDMVLSCYKRHLVPPILILAVNVLVANFVL